MSADLTPMQLGLFLLVAGMSVVFAALLTLMLALKLIRYLDQRSAARAAAPPATAGGVSVPAAAEPEVAGVVLAAIATTLLLDAQRVEDEERLVLTLRALPKPYSNWWQGRIARHEMWRPQVTNTRAEALRAPRLHGDRQA